MRKLLLSGAVIMASTAMANAVPITVSPGSLLASGNVNAVFAFADAGDMSQLLKFTMAGVIFNNKVDLVGAFKNIGLNTGLIQFQLNNLTSGVSFINDVADTGPGGDTYFHAKYGNSAADFGVTFSAPALASIALLGPSVQYVGFEDRRNGDYDYNDLIFAFSGVQAATVPEPASIALVGLSLLGVGMLRRGRKA